MPAAGGNVGHPVNPGGACTPSAYKGLAAIAPDGGWLASSAPDPGADRQALWFVFMGPSARHIACRHLVSCRDNNVADEQILM